MFLAVGPDSTLANFHSYNGHPQPDWTTIYDLIGGGMFTFDLNIVPGGEWIGGLRMTGDGHVLAMDRHGVLHEFSPSGQPLGSLSLPGLCDDVRDFTIDEDGNIWVAQNVIGDVDGDGQTDIDDLLEVLANWGPCPAPITACPADTANNDGVVGVADFLMVLAFWGCDQ